MIPTKEGGGRATVKHERAYDCVPPKRKRKGKHERGSKRVQPRDGKLSIRLRDRTLGGGERQ